MNVEKPPPYDPAKVPRIGSVSKFEICCALLGILATAFGVLWPYRAEFVSWYQAQRGQVPIQSVMQRSWITNVTVINQNADPIVEAYQTNKVVFTFSGMMTLPNGQTVLMNVRSWTNTGTSFTEIPRP